MKQLRIFSIISCFAMILYLLIFFFSGMSIAGEKEQKLLNECVADCKDKVDICMNMTADPRRCTAIYQECDDNCKSEYESSLSNSEGNNSSSSSSSGSNSSSSGSSEDNSSSSGSSGGHSSSTLK